MNRPLFLAVFSLLSLSIFGQAKEVLSIPSELPFPAPQSGAQGEQLLSLPFRDDFSKSGMRLDSNKWEDQYVQISRTLAFQPPSIGTATFDGIDDFGRAYDINRLATDTADMMTSKGFDLGNLSSAPLLSFWYQPQGQALAEEPENTDSLALYFYNPALDAWFSVWRERGSSSRAFRYVAIPVNSSFWQAGFKFRFVSYGAQAGAYDHWHLDYVLLENNRNPNDSIYPLDITFTAPHQPLTVNYTAVPWFHYNAIPQSGWRTTLNCDYIRRIPPGQTSNPDLGAYRISRVDASGTSVLAQDLDGSVGIDAGHANNVHTPFNVPLDPNYFANYTPSDEFELRAFQSWIGQTDNIFPSNDTVRLVQKFRNYYAYDDGSAERGYGIENVAGALTLVKFDVLDFARLKGLYLYFLPAGTDPTLNDFKIVVYANDNGLPGNLIYESDSSYIPQLSEGDFYLPYILDTAEIQVNGSVFIGLKQRTVQRLNIGFDASVKRSRMFFGTPNNLFESFLPGNIMMRPFFNYLPLDLKQTEFTQEDALSLYPNPVQNTLRIGGLEPDQQYIYQLYDLSGRSLAKGELKGEIDCSMIPPGLYFIQLSTEQGQLALQAKFVISR